MDIKKLWRRKKNIYIETIKENRYIFWYVRNKFIISRKHVLRFSVFYLKTKAAHTKYFSLSWANCVDKKRGRIYQSQRQWRTWDLAAAAEAVEASQLRKSNGGCDLSWPANIFYTAFCIIIFLRGFPCIDSSKITHLFLFMHIFHISSANILMIHWISIINIEK